jgi:hypothetical protein
LATNLFIVGTDKVTIGNFKRFMLFGLNQKVNKKHKSCFGKKKKQSFFFQPNQGSKAILV